VTTTLKTQQRKLRKTKMEYEKRAKLMELIFKTRTDEVMRGLNKVSLKSKVKVKRGILNSFSTSVQKQLFKLSDHVHDRNDNRINRTLNHNGKMFKNLYVVYVVRGNGEVIGWANYWKSRKSFNSEHDPFVFIHVKKQYRGNGIGRKIFKEVYRLFLKGKPNQRKYFMPNPNRHEYAKLDFKDFYDQMLPLARKGKL